MSKTDVQDLYFCEKHDITLKMCCGEASKTGYMEKAKEEPTCAE